MLAGPSRWFAATNGRISRSYPAKAAQLSPLAAASSPASTYAPTKARLVPWPDAGEAQ